ncbi:mediator complex protein-domain-containing protein [Lipomyces tetrasporus]|uniref:Mediator of RNA polymerase II transcription subunit 11 n=1 Tax=Lipomyces tetrasporus TaxID=54092 RepID=A0AAD7VRK0_9ASCO|nr:mediator complex protein-domain-containing protein [Lipomyces tetrasporus]KAJ8098739.1 mediator complex protein-domain-containing protein [Lipomyces tetrasporus]
MYKPTIPPTTRLTAEEATKHLNNLQKLDEEIIALLTHASSSLQSLNEPSTQSVDQAKQDFQTRASKFFAGLESVTVGLRREAKALQDADVLGSTVTTKAEWVGRQKEREAIAAAEAVLNKLNAQESD